MNLFEPYDIALRECADEYAAAMQHAKEAEKLADDARRLGIDADACERRAWERVRVAHTALCNEAIDRTPF